VAEATGARGRSSPRRRGVDYPVEAHRRHRSGFHRFSPAAISGADTGAAPHRMPNFLPAPFSRSAALITQSAYQHEQNELTRFVYPASSKVFDLPGGPPIQVTSVDPGMVCSISSLWSSVVPSWSSSLHPGIKKPQQSKKKPRRRPFQCNSTPSLTSPGVRSRWSGGAPRQAVIRSQVPSFVVLRFKLVDRAASPRSKLRSSRISVFQSFGTVSVCV